MAERTLAVLSSGLMRLAYLGAAQWPLYHNSSAPLLPWPRRPTANGETRDGLAGRLERLSKSEFVRTLPGVSSALVALADR
ncbi:hypothetical protein IEO21_09092 [Rhodonia placenta]|uniref:Uncharacterized protein n=1 Tax=Rhodonia placenta TaxID=104341 RepID=A0A8H7TYS3_9APHY|nr:hypothetical protein IEO21_09092 [Postia placenta]